MTEREKLPRRPAGSGKVTFTDAHSVTRFKPRAAWNDKKQKKNATRQFIAWDGEETQDAGYCLFGNSSGLYIKKPHMSTLEMLELLILTGERYPDAFHIGFGFTYDVNWILKDLPFPMLGILHLTGEVVYRNYEIHHVPHKIFKVSSLDAAGRPITTVRIDDIFSYFRQRYDYALIKYNVGSAEEQRVITDGKENRSDFHWEDIEEIQYYWQMELRLMVDLMDGLRRDINAAGYFIGQWHGPGALASYALKQHNMGEFMKQTPDELMMPVRKAYQGGWFERFKVGEHDGPVYTADVNSAYAYGISQLPNLANGQWKHRIGEHVRAGVRAARFALYHIRTREGETLESFGRYLRSCHGIPQPLFVRGPNNSIDHLHLVDGWYWNPEAATVVDDPFYEFVEAWVFEDDGTYPFAWVAEMYAERLQLIAEKNPAEKALKYTMASLYGRIAQRVGWDKKTKASPKWHQLEWAGWITSLCRSMIYEAALPVALQNGLVSIDTDGITSLVPFPEECFPTGTGNALGAWKLEEFTGMVYIQNGIYWLRDKDNWLPPKLRGIPTKRMDVQVGRDALAGDGMIRLMKHNFVGYGAALQGRRSEWRTWVDAPYSIDIKHSGNRQHIAPLCRACKQGYGFDESLHDMAIVPSRHYDSQPHVLPWLEVQDDRKLRALIHMLAHEEI